MHEPTQGGSDTQPGQHLKHTAAPHSNPVCCVHVQEELSIEAAEQELTLLISSGQEAQRLTVQDGEQTPHLQNTAVINDSNTGYYTELVCSKPSFMSCRCLDVL